MMNDQYNVHTHIFTGQCAPKDFLQVGVNLGDGASRMLKWLFLTKPVSWIILKMGNMIPAKQLQFLKIGAMASQQDVFNELRKNYTGTSLSNIKIVALTIDMDYMTDPKNKPNTNFNSQIAGVIQLKKSYPLEFFPFYGIDPRNKQTNYPTRMKVLLQNKTFSGIKIYPPKGFFPFDPRMEEVYRFAEANNIPVMTHTTRTGSYYIGNHVWSLIPDRPESLNPNSTAMQSVYRRIAAYKNSTDKEFKENKRICNLFSHPENYVPVLEKFPKLKLCFAHLGGEFEILGARNTGDNLNLYNKIIQTEGGNQSWYEWIKQLQSRFENVYTDISYTLSSKPALNAILSDLNSNSLNKERLLFGTDYFMVQQEGSEMEVIGNASSILSAYFNEMVSTNAKSYMKSNITN